MKHFFTFLSLLLSLAVFSQTDYVTVDRNAVKKAVTDSTLDTYYPKLVERLKSFDTTLSLNEYRLIYYGYVFQNKYAPYSTDKTSEIRAALDKKDYKKVIQYADEVINNNPTALSTYYYKLIALSNSNNDSLFQKVRIQYTGLVNAIISSGDGLTCPTAFKVIRVSDEYELMYRYFEIEKVKSQSLVSLCDRMNITPSKYYTEENIYFDVSESLLSLEESLKSK